MQSIRVAAVSMNSPFGKTAGILDRIGEFSEQAAAERAELVLFPELVVHGHCNPDTWELAEPVPDGPSVRRLAEIAARCTLFLSVGLSEKERDVVYNTQVLLSPDGFIGKQRKIHLSRDEGLFYAGGRDISVFDIGACRVGTVICYDNQFPELARIVALKGADVILMPHAARQGRWDQTPASQAAARRHVRDFFAMCYPMRAIENACFCMLTDQAGRAGTVPGYPEDHMNQPHHPGAALIFAPDGSILAEAQTEAIRDEMIVCDLDAELLAKARSYANYTLRTRKPELFGELVRDQRSS